jgi:hypothetical protein
MHRPQVKETSGEKTAGHCSFACDDKKSPPYQYILWRKKSVTIITIAKKTETG